MRMLAQVTKDELLETLVKEAGIELDKSKDIQDVIRDAGLLLGSKVETNDGERDIKIILGISRQAGDKILAVTENIISFGIEGISIEINGLSDEKLTELNEDYIEYLQKEKVNEHENV